VPKNKATNVSRCASATNSEEKGIQRFTTSTGLVGKDKIDTPPTSHGSSSATINNACETTTLAPIAWGQHAQEWRC
jgi:hypothetical protein